MDGKRFDAVVRSIGAAPSRRQILRGLFGIGIGIAGNSVGRSDRAGAARRGYSGPTFPTFHPCEATCDGTCGGPDGCGGTCECASGAVCRGGVCFTTCDRETNAPCPQCYCLTGCGEASNVTFCHGSCYQHANCVERGCFEGFVCDPIADACIQPC